MHQRHTNTTAVAEPNGRRLSRRVVTATDGQSFECQIEMFGKSIAEQFAVWKETPGGKVVLQYAYKLAAGQAHKFLRYGQRGSIRLIWEQLRYRLHWIRLCAARKRVSLEKWGGYVLNDHFHAHVARHIMAHRAEWKGMFELREQKPKQVERKTVTVVTERVIKPETQIAA